MKRMNIFMLLSFIAVAPQMMAMDTHGQKRAIEVDPGETIETGDAKRAISQRDNLQGMLAQEGKGLFYLPDTGVLTREELFAKIQIQDAFLEGEKKHLVFYDEELLKEIEEGKEVIARRTPQQERNKRLFSAIEKGDREAVENALKNGAFVSARNEKTGLTPLHTAAEKGMLDLVRLLLQENAEVNVQTFQDVTPLHLAIKNSNFAICKELVLRGADVNALEYQKKWTPLHMAVKIQHIGIVNLLLDMCALVDSQTGDGFTPLHIAARYGHEKIVTILLQRGARKDLKTVQGRTPEQIAQNTIKRSANSVDSDSLQRIIASLSFKQCMLKR